MEFKESFRIMRSEIGMSQVELASILHVKGKTVSRWEVGESSPHARTLQEILELAKRKGVSKRCLQSLESSLPKERSKVLRVAENEMHRSALDVLDTLVHAYYDERDIEKTLACVTEDIEWVGTENNDSAFGKKELRALLQADVEEFPDSLTVETGKPIVQQLGSDAVVITTTGEQAEYPGKIAGFAVRATICCVNTVNGWLVSNVHVSVPNAEAEKFLLMLNTKKEQDYYRAILDLTQTTYFEIDKKHRFHFSDSFRNYKVSEYGISAIMGEGEATRCIHPDDVDTVKDFLHKVHMNGTCEPTIIRMLMTDGSYQWTELTAHVEFDEQHHIERMTGILRNVSIEWEKQRDSLELALGEAKRANQAKTDFLSRVSHDMRTPLNVILSIAKMAPEERPSYDMLLSYFHSIDEEGSFLLRLINDVLDMQKMESGVIDINPEPVALAGIINPIIERATHLAKKKDIEFTVTIEKFAEDVTALIDPLRTQQLLNNLLANAIKYTPENGKVALILENLSIVNMVATDKIIVRDNGIGMSKEFMKHMYDPFMQENGGSTSVTRGSGLGLSIVKKIVDIMGGSISCTSEPGKGTEFTVILKTPLVKTQEGADASKDLLSTRDDLALVGRRILMCEDHPLNAMIAEKLMRRKGLIVTSAENGQIGLDYFKLSTEGYYDAIMMDVRMPVMDGLETTRAIRALPREDAKKIPIIAMTANAYKEDVENCLNAGMNAHIAKPIEPEKVWDALYQYMDFSKKIQKLKVIVVDDIEVNRVVVAQAVSNLYEPLLAESGAQALALLSRYSDIVAVITDIMMPEMDGQELIRTIRAKHEYDNIAILANTQYGEREKEEELLKDGADDFIYKPTTPAIIIARLKNILMRRNNMTRSN